MLFGDRKEGVDSHCNRNEPSLTASERLDKPADTSSRACATLPHKGRPGGRSVGKRAGGRMVLMM